MDNTPELIEGKDYEICAFKLIPPPKGHCCKSDYGIFKGTYRGCGVYYRRGRYNADGMDCGSTLAEMSAALDRHISLCDERDRQEKARKIASGRYIPCTREEDTVTAETPDGAIACSIREFRNRICEEIEEKYNREIIWR